MNMEKQYMSPKIKAMVIEKPCILAGSVAGSGKYDMRYGGVDEEGEYDPE